jgi:hypothetical protein
MSSSAPASVQRGAARAKIFQPGVMHTISGTQRIHLLDVSPSGALVYTAEEAPTVGAVVRLSAVVALGPARVKWVSGKRFGVSFPTPLSAECLDQMLDAQRTLNKRIEEQPGIPSGD